MKHPRLSQAHRNKLAVMLREQRNVDTPFLTAKEWRQIIRSHAKSYECILHKRHTP